jgi:hypothetical protein
MFLRCYPGASCRGYSCKLKTENMVTATGMVVLSRCELHATIL